jgi:hypothetical protein
MGGSIMTGTQVFEGSWEEISAHADDLKDRDDLMLIVPSRGRAANDAGRPRNLAEAMKGYIGSCDFGDANLSVNTSEKYAKLLAERYRKGEQ